MRATDLDLTPALKDTGRSSSALGRSWLSKSLVVVQVSVSVLLLIGAGLLVRTLRNLQHVETGFNANNLLLFNVDPGLLGFKDEKLVDALRTDASAGSKLFRACNQLRSHGTRCCRLRLHELGLSAGRSWTRRQAARE